MSVSQAQYDAGTAAALKLMQQEIQDLVPGMFRGMIPVDQEPVLAAQVAKLVLDAADRVPHSV